MSCLWKVIHFTLDRLTGGAWAELSKAPTDDEMEAMLVETRQLPLFGTP